MKSIQTLEPGGGVSQVPILRAHNLGKGVREQRVSGGGISVSVSGEVVAVNVSCAEPWIGWSLAKIRSTLGLSFIPSSLSHPSWHLTPLRCTLGTILPAPTSWLLYLLSINHVKVFVENSSRYYPSGEPSRVLGVFGSCSQKNRKASLVGCLPRPEHWSAG